MNVISVQDVSKDFKIYIEKNTTLKEKLVYFGRARYKKFRALDHVNLEIQMGETVGLIGSNGSGKSTLLKIMTKILYPTSGNVEVAGRVSSLLELGAGFHPDFTGRENIFMNASILGFTKSQIQNRIDRIIEFSELEEFIDHPVRSYSSGMYTRLAFSVAINVDPDILLVDEVLAVGDASFQRKCLERIRQLKSEGKTIVIVSHDHGTLERLCDRVVWMNRGKIKLDGEPKQVIDQYLIHLDRKDEERKFLNHPESDRENVYNGVENHPKMVDHMVDAPPVLPSIENAERWGNGKVEITETRIIDTEGKQRTILSTGEHFQIELYYKIHQRVDDVAFGVGFFNADGISCYGTNTFIDHCQTSRIPAAGKVVFDVPKLPLLAGSYRIDIAAHSIEGIPYDYTKGRLSFTVSSLINDAGICRFDHSWKITELDEGV